MSRRKYQEYKPEGLIRIQEYYKWALEGVRFKILPEPGGGELIDVSVFKKKEIARIKRELNEVWKEKVIRKLIPEREE